jgi:hypothetical protein
MSGAGFDSARKKTRLEIGSVSFKSFAANGRSISLLLSAATVKKVNPAL